VFQIYCYSENLVVPAIEPGTSGLAARNSDQRYGIKIAVKAVGDKLKITAPIQDVTTDIKSGI
jgi:hypothetical protein